MRKIGQFIGLIIIAGSIQNMDKAMFVIGFVVLGAFTFKMSLSKE